MRLIDADALKDYIDCGHLRPLTELCFSELDVCNMIDERPTIEAVDMAIEALQEISILAKPSNTVEVVRCRDCKHYTIEGETTNFGWCGHWNKPADEMRYCSDGEREG